ncbi:dihydroxyacetone kinase family protein [Rhizosaccharibacter radicis]|uniref:Dihydroxyacetone kinase family protein n=1 Tax=Rhizosaccharibacter radicis TaxID=2782605 RepID=A0ABT1VUQ2_9PROT|nr:dihydroxyacetone kinase family protein [Acetobacteraceae bacterium KSS12]
MTHIVDDADHFAEQALAGFCDVHGRLVRPVTGGVVRATATPENKVALVIGGGSGHYPVFNGYVGPGLGDAAVAGDVFASPATRLIANVARKAHRGGGVVLCFGNYAGDVLNFGFAAERLRADGIDTRVVPVTDDVVSAPRGQEARRRGVAGDVMVLKVAGAAAEAGLGLDEVERLARHANDRTRSFGVAFGGCTLPGADGPLFTVPEGRMAIGLGIHGEPGIDEQPTASAAELGALLVRRLLEDAPDGATGGRVAVLLNGLGGTKYEELFVLWTHVASALRGAGLALVAPLVGEYVTSLDMEGCSLTICWLDEELERFWLAPCDSPALRIGTVSEAGPAAPLPPDDAEAGNRWTEAPAPSREAGAGIARALDALATALRGAEEELGRIDALAGDGDHGQGMTRGAAAAAAGAREAAGAGAGAASVLAAAADSWADRAGGTSGAIWGLGLRSAAGALSDERAPDAAAVAAAARAAIENVMRLGGAKPGDKTLVDAFEPFARVLSGALDAGTPLSEAWSRASEAAHAAAEGTKDLLPQLGRARNHAERSRGHRDAGAVSFALAARTVGEFVR